MDTNQQVEDLERSVKQLQRAVLALLVCVGWCVPVAHADPEPRTIMLIGDSITAGVVAAGDMQGSWARRLVRAVAGRGWQVRNIGVPGTDSYEWSSVLQWATPLFGYPDITDVDRGEPIVVLALGTNDALAFSTLPIGVPHSALEYAVAMDSNLASLMHGRRYRRVLLLAPTTIPWLVDTSINGSIAVYQNWCMDRAATRKRVRCLVPVIGPGGYIDGNVHPTASGHMDIHNAVLLAIEDWL